MKKLIRYNLPIAGFGIAACMLLMLSRYFNAHPSVRAQALDHVMVVVILCICVHFVRRTAALTHIHVWNSKMLSFLWLMPVFNLGVIAIQLVLGNNPLFSHPVFLFISVLLSLPAFFCLYFVFVAKTLCRTKVMIICSSLLWLCGGVYIILRIVKELVVSSLQNAGNTIPEFLLKVTSASSSLSIVIYLLSIICLCVFWYYTERKQKSAGELRNDERK